MKLLSRAPACSRAPAWLRERGARGWLVWLCLGALVCGPLRVQAQSVSVLEASEQDRPAADTLATLLEQPIRRRQLQPGAAADLVLACARDTVDHVVFFAAEQGLVQVMPCDGGGLLTRRLQPGAAADPQVSAFVATELLTLDAELAAQRPEHGLRLRLRAAAELLGWADSYAGMLRPHLGAGLGFTPRGSRWTWFAELGAAFAGSVTQDIAGSRLALARHDLQARAGSGIGWRFLQLEGFVLGSCVLTSADYLASTGDSALRARWAVGAGVELQGRVWPWLRVTGSFALSAALSRSNYLYQGLSLAQDPTWFAQIVAGLLFTPRL